MTDGLRESIVASVTFGKRHETLVLPSAQALDAKMLYEAVRNALELPEDARILVARYSKSEDRFVPLKTPAQFATFARSMRVKSRFKLEVTEKKANDLSSSGEQSTEHTDGQVDSDGKEAAKEAAKEAKRAKDEAKAVAKRARQEAHDAAKRARDEAREAAKLAKYEAKRAREQAKAAACGSWASASASANANAGVAGYESLTDLVSALSVLPEFIDCVRHIADGSAGQDCCSLCHSRVVGRVLTCVTCTERPVLCARCTDGPEAARLHRGHRAVCSGAKFNGNVDEFGCSSGYGNDRPSTNTTCSACSTVLPCGGYACLTCKDQHVLCDMCFCTKNDLGTHAYTSSVFTDSAKKCTECGVAATGPLYVCQTCGSSNGGKDLRVCGQCVSSRRGTSLSAHASHVFAADVHASSLRDGDRIMRQLSSRAWCDGCAKPICGQRWKCLTCEDFDLCTDCFMSPKYYEHGHEAFCVSAAPPALPRTTQHPRPPCPALGMRRIVACDLCNRIVTGRPYVHCPVCPDFDMCLDCYVARKGAHGHAMLPVGGAEAEALCPPPPPPPRRVGAMPCVTIPAAPSSASTRSYNGCDSNAKCTTCGHPVSSRSRQSWCVDCAKVLCRQCEKSIDSYFSSVHAKHRIVGVNQHVRGAICDMCDEAICGVRFKCMKCYDYDMCERCYDTRRDSHAGDHAFLQFDTPVCIGEYWCACKLCRARNFRTFGDADLWFTCTQCEGNDFCSESVRQGVTEHDHSHRVRVVVGKSGVSTETFVLGSLIKKDQLQKEASENTAKPEANADADLISLDDTAGTVVEQLVAPDGTPRWTIANNTGDYWPADVVLVAPAVGAALAMTGTAQATAPQQSAEFIGQVCDWTGAFLVSRSAGRLWSVEPMAVHTEPNSGNKLDADSEFSDLQSGPQPMPEAESGSDAKTEQKTEQDIKSEPGTSNTAREVSTDAVSSVPPAPPGPPASTGSAGLWTAGSDYDDDSEDQMDEPSETAMDQVSRAKEEEKSDSPPLYESPAPELVPEPAPEYETIRDPVGSDNSDVEAEVETGVMVQESLESSTGSAGGYATATQPSTGSLNSASGSQTSQGSAIILPTLPRESPESSVEDIMRVVGGHDGPHSTTDADHGVLSDSDFSDNEYDVIDSGEVFSDFSELTS